jgi:hypothetical protein
MTEAPGAIVTEPAPPTVSGRLSPLTTAPGPARPTCRSDSVIGCVPLSLDRRTRTCVPPRLVWATSRMVRFANAVVRELLIGSPQLATHDGGVAAAATPGVSASATAAPTSAHTRLMTGSLPTVRPRRHHATACS